MKKALLKVLFRAGYVIVTAAVYQSHPSIMTMLALVGAFSFFGITWIDAYFSDGGCSDSDTDSISLRGQKLNR